MSEAGQGYQFFEKPEKVWKIGLLGKSQGIFIKYDKTQ